MGHCGRGQRAAQLTTTIDIRQNEVLAFLDTRASNTAAESARIESLRLRNTDSYRARTFIHAGEPGTPPQPRGSGPKPSSLSGCRKTP